MSSINLTLPDDLKSFVEAEAAAGGFDSADAYVQQVLRSVWKEKKKAELEASLLASIESGPPIEVTPESRARMVAELRAYGRSAGGQPPQPPAGTTTVP